MFETLKIQSWKKFESPLLWDATPGSQRTWYVVELSNRTCKGIYALSKNKASHFKICRKKIIASNFFKIPFPASKNISNLSYYIFIAVNLCNILLHLKIL